MSVQAYNNNNKKKGSRSNPYGLPEKDEFVKRQIFEPGRSDEPEKLPILKPGDIPPEEDDEQPKKKKRKLNNNKRKRDGYESSSSSSSSDDDEQPPPQKEHRGSNDLVPKVSGYSEVRTDDNGLLLLPETPSDIKVRLQDLTLKNERIDSKTEWFPQQWNGTDNIVPCPFVSMDLVKLHDLRPINSYDENNQLRPVLNIAPDDPEHEQNNQVLGVWRSEKWGTQVPIQQFRWDIVGTDFTISVEGKRRTGKTHFITALCYQMRRYFTDVVVFTKTSFNGDFERFVPRRRIINDFNAQLLNATLDAQKKRYEQAIKDSKSDPNGLMKNVRLLIICDDVLSADVAYRYNKAIDRLFFEGRHYKCSIIVTSQDSKGLPPALKQNTDLKIIFPMTAKRDRETVMENSFTFIQNDRDYKDFIDQLLIYKHQFACNLNAKATIPPWLQVFTGITPPIEEIPQYVLGTYISWREDLNQLYGLGEWAKGLASDTSLQGWDIEEYMFRKPELKKERLVYPYPASINYEGMYDFIPRYPFAYHGMGGKPT